MKTFKTSLVNVVLAALALCTMVRAEAPKEFPPAKIEATQIDGPKQAPTGRTYTAETLRTMLDNMGYDYKALADSAGAYYVVNLNQDGWDFHILVECSADGSVIWFNATLGECLEGDQAPAAALLTLLEKNTRESGKAVFHKSGKQIVLSQPMDNHDVTPPRFRAELERLCTTVKAMQPYYAAVLKAQPVAKVPAKDAEAVPAPK